MNVAQLFGGYAKPMFERILDKSATPDEAAIQKHLGRQGYARLSTLESRLEASYQLDREIKFPFGNDYGWGYKYNHKSSHLCYVFFENGAFTVMFQIGDKQVPLVEDVFSSLLSKTQRLWKSRYPCGKCGGWVHYRVSADDELADVIKLLAIRKKPATKQKRIS